MSLLRQRLAVIQTQTNKLADSRSNLLVKKLAQILATQSDLDQLLSDAFAAVKSGIGYDRATLNVIDYEAECRSDRLVIKIEKRKMKGAGG